MCDKNNLSHSAELIATFFPILEQLRQEECENCRQPCDDVDENETWQYFEGFKYCYDCWDELNLENQL
jgi:hypothetical protein